MPVATLDEIEIEETIQKKPKIGYQVTIKKSGLTDYEINNCCLQPQTCSFMQCYDDWPGYDD